MYLLSNKFAANIQFVSTELKLDEDVVMAAVFAAEKGRMPPGEVPGGALVLRWVAKDTNDRWSDNDQFILRLLPLVSDPHVLFEDISDRLLHDEAFWVTCCHVQNLKYDPASYLHYAPPAIQTVVMLSLPDYLKCSDYTECGHMDGT